jgi:hypothetical protein
MMLNSHHREKTPQSSVIFVDSVVKKDSRLISTTNRLPIYKRTNLPTYFLTPNFFINTSFNVGTPISCNS